MSDNTLDNTETQVFVSAQKLMKQTLNEKHLNPTNNIPKTSITTGFNAINKITKGFQKGELATIAVRPGIGKTSFLISMINNVALCECHSVGVFSLERKSHKLLKRLIQSTTGISMDKINEGTITDVEYNHVRSLVNSISKSNLIFEDQAGMSTDTLADKAKKMQELGVEIIFIDYLELLHTNNENENCEDDKCVIMKELHQLAKDINIPIVLFSQLQKPIIYKNKFKYTPDFVNDNTDTLIFLNRPSYYHINQIDKVSEDVAEITIAKNINIGEMQIAELKIIENLGQFKDFN
jgi:replicative DNA helicase